MITKLQGPFLMQGGTKADEADSTLLLTYWLRVLIAKGHYICHMVLHFLCFAYQVIITFLSINLGYPYLHHC